MARTAVVNKKRSTRRKSTKRTGSGRRRKTRRTTRGKRRSNPGRGGQITTTPKRRRGAARRRNPGAGEILDIDEAMYTMPAAGLGSFAARWATKFAGPFESVSAGDPVPRPGFKHALAILIAAGFGGDLIGDILGDERKGTIAKIGAYTYGADLFARKWLFVGNTWMQQNLYLGDDYNYSSMSGLQPGAGGLGDTFTDSAGNKYTRTPQGWQLAGLMPGSGGLNEQPMGYDPRYSSGAMGWDPRYYGGGMGHLQPGPGAVGNVDPWGNVYQTQPNPGYGGAVERTGDAREAYHRSMMNDGGNSFGY